MKDPNPAKKPGFFSRHWFSILLILLALGLAGYLWVNNELALKKQMQAFKTEKNELIQTAETNFETTTSQQLELMMRTFAWAVRGEVTRGNMEQVDLFFTQLVKEDRVNEIILADTAGKILLSSNKKNEGTMLPTNYGEDILNTEQVLVKTQNEMRIAGVPIMSLDSRFGTLIVVFKKEGLDLSKFQYM